MDPKTHGWMKFTAFDNLEPASVQVFNGYTNGIATFFVCVKIYTSDSGPSSPVDSLP